MRRVRTLPLALLAALCAGVAAPGAAAQEIPAPILEDFRADRRVGPCDHSAAAVRRARAELPADADVLTPDLREQLEASAEAHTSGRCRAAAAARAGSDDGAVGPAPAEPGAGALAAQEATDRAARAARDRPPGSPAQPNPTAQPVPANSPAPTARDDAITRATRVPPGRTGAGDAPAALLLLLLVALLAAAALLVWAIARAAGAPPPGSAGARHARREAAWRASNVWSEFTDWVRLGR
jgi:hypothetical protein